MNRFARVLAVFIVGFLLLPLVHAVTIEEKIAQYRLKNETADVGQITVENASYFLVRFNENLSLIFNESLHLVEDENVVQNVLYSYYQSAGKLGFNDVAAQEINNSFYQALVSYQPCNKVFYDLVEDNFLIRDYRCIETNTGRICDVSFAYRKNISDNFVLLNKEVDQLVPLSVSGDSETILAALSKVRDYSKTLETDIGNFEGYYKYFRGDTLASDPKCGYNPSPLRTVRTKAENGIAAGVTDVKGDAKKLLEGYEERKLVEKLKGVQEKGEKLLEEIQNFSARVEETYLVDALKNNVSSLKQEFEEHLKRAKNVSEGEAAFQQLSQKADAVKAYEESIEGVLEAYKNTSEILQNTSTALSKAKTKYGPNDERLPKLEQKYVELGQKLDNERTEIEIGNALNRSASVSALQKEAQELYNRVSTLPAKESEVDPLMVAALAVILLTVAGLVYYFKLRKPRGGKEVDVRALYKKQEEQNRKALTPRPEKS